MKTILSLVIALCLASFASAQCNVRASADTASAAAVLQQQQLATLLAQQGGASATAIAGNPAVAQQLALIQAQNRAAAASALAAPAVVVPQSVCANGSCSTARARSVVRTLARPVIVRPLRSRTRSVAVSSVRG